MHPTELAFITAIHQNPRDDAIRLVFADWLEERDDPYGEFIRLQCLEPWVVVMTPKGKTIALPDCTPECAKKGRRLLELFPAVIAAERFAFWHQRKPLFFRGLCYLTIMDDEALHFDPPPLARLSIVVYKGLLKQLLPLPLMNRVDHIQLLPPFSDDKDQLLALLEWPGLQDLDSVTMCGGPCEAVERLSQRVKVEWVRG
jgi:uncharacterized protein (TIGR02996 family)